MRHVSFALSTLLLAPICSAAPNFPTVTIAGVPLTVEVADTEKTQRQGLMFRETLGENHGMLFIFDSPKRVCMYMKNVPIDLDVGFFDRSGHLIGIAGMTRQTLNLHCSPLPAKYAVETNRGWFAKNRIPLGATLTKKETDSQP